MTPNKRSLTPEIIHAMPKPLKGYLLLKPIFIPIEKFESLPMPVIFNRGDLFYISEELNKLTKEKNDSAMNLIDYGTFAVGINSYDDSTSDGTTDSIPVPLRCSCLVDDLDKHRLLERWLNDF